MYHPLNKRKILAVCIAASIVSHLCSFLFLQRHTLWYFSPTLPTQEIIQLVDQEKVNKNQILKESFDFSAFDEMQTSEPVKEKRSLIFNELQTPKQELIDRTSVPDFPSFPNPQLSIAPQTLSFPLPHLEPFDLSGHLPKELAVPPPLAYQILATPPSLHREDPLVLAATPIIQKEKAPSPIIAYPHPFLSVPLDAPSLTPKIETLTSFPELPALPTLEELETSSYSDYFDTEIVFSPLEAEEGYLFALTLIPHQNLNLPKIRQHYSFLIDRSNSVQKERLAVVKSAVLKAIEELDFEDSFNIIAFDSKIDKFAPAPIPATPSSVKRAKDFLEEIGLGSFFSPANLHKPLSLVIPASDEDLHTAILLTDGESLGKKTAQRELAMGWTAYNSGRVSLFWVGLQGDPHLEILSATTALNRGKILHAPSKRGIKRKLLKLMKTISHPIAKDLSVRGISYSPESEVSLYPHSSGAPHLYSNEPYVILGKVKSLEPFILFVQGRVKDRWLNIKKTISFVNGKKGTHSLTEQWALQCSYALYEQYLRDLNPEHLVEAHELLQPYGLQVVLQ